MSAKKQVEKYEQLSYFMTAREAADYLDMATVTIDDITVKQKKIDFIKMRSYDRDEHDYLIYTRSVQDYKARRDFSHADLMSKREAAKYLGKSVFYVDVYRFNGTLRWGYGPNKNVFVMREDVEELARMKGLRDDSCSGKTVSDNEK